MSISDSDLASSIGKGLSFLYRHQLLHGEFLNYFSDTEDMTAPCSPESITFNTSLICFSMSFLSEDYEEADRIIAKAVNFLNAHSKHGMLCFASKTSRIYTYLLLT